METIWELSKVNEQDVDDIVRQYGVHPVIGRLLAARGITADKELYRFFNGSFMDISSPFAIDGMKKAATMLAEAVANKQRILVFGDYDVDGTTATVIMLQLLRSLNADVDFFIPHRLDDGYGLSVDCAARLLQEKQPHLVVTVDCGITAFDAIAYFKSHGVNVVLTDHHLPVGELPRADVIVNPKLYPGIESENSCGAVVAFKLALAVAQIISGSDKVLPHLRQVMTGVIPLAALATIADVMPLCGENRLIVSKGLSMLRSSSQLQPGIRALLKNVGLENSPVSSTDIGFKIAPRINAAGRLADAGMVVKLLCAESDAVADSLVAELEDLNNYRRQLCEQVEGQVDQIIAATFNLDTCSALVVAGSDWHKGVIGVVAARATERYNRPVIIFTQDEDGVLCGSGRAVNDLDIKATLDSCADLLVRYGGHKGAAGLALKEEDLAEFTRRFQVAVSDGMTSQSLKRVISIDTEVEHDCLDMALAESMGQLEPFGEGNRKPMLLANGLSVANVRTVGAGDRHLKVRFATEYGTLIDAVGFSLGERFEEVKEARTIDVVFFPAINEWRGRRTLDLQIEDLRVVE